MFRWSSASSRHLGFEGEHIGALEPVGPENAPAAVNAAGDPQCSLCGRPLWQKSPWTSHHSFRNGDMPAAGVLPCGHIFHAECLEETTPRALIRDPPCPLCLNPAGPEGFLFSQPLEAALRCARRRRAAASSDAPRVAGDGDGGRTRSPHSLRGRYSFFLKNPFKKGKTGFGKMSLSSSQGLWAWKKPVGHSS